MDRDTAIKEIRAALRRRSGKSWSVRGGRGSSWGWLTITAPPARRGGPYEPLRNPDRAELAKLLGKDDVHHQGEIVPAGAAYYREYVDRANGRTPTVVGTPYWD